MSDTPSSSSLNTLRIDRSAPAARRRRPWGWLALGGAVAVGVLAWLLSPKVTPVQTTAVVTAAASQQHVLLTASGYVVAQRRAAVASKATGRLVELHVREGSAVRQGELIARIDASDVQAAIVAAEAAVRQAEAGVRQAEVELANAQAEVVRSKGLQAQGFVSPQAVDAVQTRANAAQAAVASAQAGLAAARAQVKVQQVARDFTEIRAPFDGVVLVKNANVGDVITPLSSAAGTQGAVVTMADMTTLEVEADVSEGSLSQARIGQPVEITLDALPGVRFIGQVGSIVPTVDRAKATVTTKVRFNQLDPRVLPEMSAKVAFLAQPITAADQQPLLAVPPGALAQHAGQPVVWRIVTEGAGDAARMTVQPVRVKPGRKLGEVQEVTPEPADALKSGDKVVLQPGAALEPGSRVRPAQP
ncbi:efflux RND transporter periplasmic adaptor subunit [Aquabacterium fontiphilum]|jgi:RND family efflux transporter MFP subunit|uniref:efflux RND transporter periplasmic adaptor subunit n=1 Tax=Aquabacterium fontiphilum TaxID=450365 RepID=UPI0013790235|nr:efflux RND transporter periplasmic adaptor subunit [Aquabacterium fontiphilum]NBD20432.1 efflux RND transporter periplasmic adaptor subunit [Aquabacterium fontiphilum]